MSWVGIKRVICTDKDHLERGGIWSNPGMGWLDYQEAGECVAGTGWVALSHWVRSIQVSSAEWWSCQGTCDHRSWKAVAIAMTQTWELYSLPLLTPVLFQSNSWVITVNSWPCCYQYTSKQLQNIYACWQRDIRRGCSGFIPVERSVPKVFFPLEPPSQGR